MDSENKKRIGGILYLPVAVILGVLGLGSPVDFSTVSEYSLQDVGEASKTVDEEMLRQLRQNNIGPAEMLLPLASLNKRPDFANAIAEKKKSHPSCRYPAEEASSICSLSTSISEVWINTIWRGRFEAFFVYNRATTRGDLWERLRDDSSNDNVQALLRSIPVDGRPGFFWTRLMNEPGYLLFLGESCRLIDFPFFTGRRVCFRWAEGSEVFDSNLTEAQVRDLCMAEAKVALAEYKGDASWFDVGKWARKRN